MSDQLFQELYNRHYRQLLAYLVGRTNNMELSRDLLHDVYLSIWNHIDTAVGIEENKRLYWMFSIASNRLKDYYRKTTNHRKAESLLRAVPNAANGAAQSEDLSGLLAKQEQFRELEEHIYALPEDLRSVLLMKVLGGMSSTQIGLALGMPAGTIRYKLMQARGILSDQLGLSRERRPREVRHE